MTIQEAEQRTGLPKQTIRYYEKAGLLHPTRNRGNAYREFSTEDIRTLKLIKLFRKLGFPLATIAQLLRGETELRPAIEQQDSGLAGRGRPAGKLHCILSGITRGAAGRSN